MQKSLKMALKETKEFLVKKYRNCGHYWGSINLGTEIKISINSCFFTAAKHHDS